MSQKLTPKIDTKEKMHVLTFQEEELTAKMAEDLKTLLVSFLDKEIKNLVVSFAGIKKLDISVAELLLSIQQSFYDNKASMVFCNFSREILKELKDADILDEINYTPTESEAWDIVQMEEIERELFE